MEVVLIRGYRCVDLETDTFEVYDFKKNPALLKLSRDDAPKHQK